MKLRKIFLILIALVTAVALFAAACGGDDSADKTTNPDDLERVTQTLVQPPFLPAH